LVTTRQCTWLVALTGRDYAGSGKPRIAWEDPAAREETALVNDALACWQPSMSRPAEFRLWTFGNLWVTVWYQRRLHARAPARRAR
jgi:hypothetical protein